MQAPTTRLDETKAPAFAMPGFEHRHLLGIAGMSEHDIRHLFVMIGAVPNTAWLGDCVMTDERGFIVAGGDLPTTHLVSAQWTVNRMPYTGETSRPGVFAVGDVRSGSVKRVASAVGEGAISAQFLYKVVHEEGIGKGSVAAE